MVYEGRLLPQAYWNQVIHCDAGPNVVRAYPAQVQGAGYRAEILNLIEGARDKWFRRPTFASLPMAHCSLPIGMIQVWVAQHGRYGTRATISYLAAQSRVSSPQIRLVDGRGMCSSSCESGSQCSLSRMDEIVRDGRSRFACTAGDVEKLGPTLAGASLVVDEQAIQRSMAFDSSWLGAKRT